MLLHVTISRPDVTILTNIQTPGSCQCLNSQVISLLRHMGAHGRLLVVRAARRVRSLEVVLVDPKVRAELLAAGDGQCLVVCSLLLLEGLCLLNGRPQDGLATLRLDGYVSIRVTVLCSRQARETGPAAFGHVIHVPKQRVDPRPLQLVLV